MIVRSAVLEGTVAEADRPAFDRHMRESVLAAISRYPGLRKVTLRKPVEVEADAPPIYMVFDLHFDTLTAMHGALASPIRQDVRKEIAAGMSAFNGRVYHLILEDVGEVGPAV